MLKKQRQRRRASITSLIDVIFLLLLFFMLASTFQRYAEVEVAAATEAGGTAAPEQKIVRVFIEPQAILMNDDAVLEEELATALSAEKRGEKLVVTISFSEKVTTQRLVDVLSTLSAVPDASLHLTEAS
jgi:biopolymer transport protein ExbD